MGRPPGSPPAHIREKDAPEELSLMHPGGAPSSEAGSLKVLAAGPVLADRRSALWAIYLAFPPSHPISNVFLGRVGGFRL